MRNLLDRGMTDAADADGLKYQFVEAVHDALTAVEKAATQMEVQRDAARRNGPRKSNMKRVDSMDKRAARNRARQQQHARTPAVRIAALGSAVARLQEYNVNDGEPDDDAGAKVEEASEVVNQIAGLQDRLTVSYYAQYVEKEIRELLRPTVLAVRVAQVAMVQRADGNLQRVEVKKAKLDRRNNNTGNPDDVGTRLLKDSAGLIQAAKVAQAAKDGGKMDDPMVAGDFIEAVQKAAAAVHAAGVAITERAKAVIQAKVDALREATAIVDDLVARNAAVGRPDDKGTQFLNSAVRAVTKADIAASNRHDNPDSPDAADEFMEAVDAALPVLEKAREAVMSRQDRLLKQAVEDLQGMSTAADKLAAEDEEDGRPDDEAGAAVEEALSCVEAARDAHEDMQGSPNDAQLLGKFLLAIAPAQAALSTAANRIADRLNAAASDAAERAGNLASNYLPELEARQKAAGAPKDEATRLVEEVKSTAAHVREQKATLEGRADRGTDEWKRAARELAKAVPILETAVEAAKQSLDERDTAMLEGVEKALAKVTAQYQHVEQRDACADVGDDKAAGLVRSSRRTLGACTKLLARLQVADTQDTRAIVGLRNKVTRCAKSVKEAALAVAKREAQITKSAEAATVDARRKLDKFIARNHVRLLMLLVVGADRSL